MDYEAVAKSGAIATVVGILVGLPLYVLGGVSAPYFAGVSAVILGAVGFAGGFALGLANALKV